MAKRQRQLTKRERKAAPSPATTAFGAQLGQKVLPDGRKVRVEQHSGHGPKMSELLLEWAAPLLEPIERRDLGLYRNVLSFAALIWNEATESDDAPDVVADEVIRRFGAGSSALESMRDLIADLVADRREVYGDDLRIILETDARDSADRRHVSVATTTPG